jgi:hypothetical protein
MLIYRKTANDGEKRAMKTAKRWGEKGLFGGFKYIHTIIHQYISILKSAKTGFF